LKFFVDYENQCQNFVTPDMKLPRDFEIHLFMRKDGECPTFSGSNLRVEIHRAKTNAPEAADHFLAYHLLSLYSNSRPWGDRIFLVKGSERGYGEIAFRLKENLGDQFQELDGTDSIESKYSTIFPKLWCEYCKRLFSDEDKASQHKNNVSCSYCHEIFSCQGHKTKEQENHGRSFSHKICRDVGCGYSSPCKKLYNLNHVNSHPKCTNDDCMCEAYFLDQSRLEQHYRELDMVECEYCKSKFDTDEECWEHTKIFHESSLPMCPKCYTRVRNAKNLKKHDRKCHS